MRHSYTFLNVWLSECGTLILFLTFSCQRVALLCIFCLFNPCRGSRWYVFYPLGFRWRFRYVFFCFSKSRRRHRDSFLIFSLIVIYPELAYLIYSRLSFELDILQLARANFRKQKNSSGITSKTVIFCDLKFHFWVTTHSGVILWYVKSYFKLTPFRITIFKPNN